MNLRQQRSLCLTVSTALGLLFAYWALAPKEPGDSVLLVDVRGDIEQGFRDRSRGAAESKGLAPGASVPVGRYDFGELSEKMARKIFPSIKGPNKRLAYDKQAFYWGVPGFTHSAKGRGKGQADYTLVNNSLGFRREEEVMQTQPDLRILVTGDSHTEGVVAMPEHFTEITEANLRASTTGSVEVLNGGVGGYSFFNYLGVIAKFKDLKPDYCVVAIYGGNDFRGVMRLYCYFNRSELPDPIPAGQWKKAKKILERSSQFFGQFINQAITLHFLPEQRALIQKATLELVVEINDYCKGIGTQLVLLYIPALFDVQPQYAERHIEFALEQLDWNREDLNHADNMADVVMNMSLELGIPFVDLRGPYREAKDPVYWRADHHINTLGHAIAAEQLTRAIQKLRSE